MAMNEDSVVSSLNELRKMANDRARRETEARARVDSDRTSQQHSYGSRRGGIRATEIRNPGYQDVSLPVQGHAPTLMGGLAAQPAAGPNAGYGGYGYGYGQTGQQPMVSEPYQEPVRQKSAVGAVLVTILFLGVAAGGGYWKLQQDWSSTLRARDEAILQAEEGRNKAVEAAARAEQLAKVQIAACEQRTKGASAEPTPAPAAAHSTAASIVAPAAPAVAVAKPARMSRAEKLAAKRARRAAASSRHVAARPAPAPVAAAPAPAPEEKKPPAMPKIAGKK
jgi:hypothetical protein